MSSTMFPSLAHAAGEKLDQELLGEEDAGSLTRMLASIKNTALMSPDLEIGLERSQNKIWPLVVAPRSIKFCQRFETF